jgi:nitrite reductase (NADH) large subunit
MTTTSVLPRVDRHRLKVISGPGAGKLVEVSRALVIGRRNADLTIADDELSRRHAVVRPGARGLEVEDLGSLNGTFVDGARLRRRAILAAGSTFRVGTSEIAVELSALVSDLAAGPPGAASASQIKRSAPTRVRAAAAPARPVAAAPAVPLALPMAAPARPAPSDRPRRGTGEGPANPFPNYTQLRKHAPVWVWHVGRVVSVAAAIGLCVVLVTAPATGLTLWWKLAVPLLPAVWLTVPGLWRNLCPLAASNQTPRLLRFTRGLTVPAWYREYAPVVGMAAFMVLVASRQPVFNQSGPATAALIGLSLVGAFTGGLVFKGKSGWCSSICPLLPVQRVYGQTPYVTVANSHCQPCVGCTSNCYDFNPRVAYLADLYEEDDHYTGYRKLFVGALPGLVYCYFTLPGHISAVNDYARFAAYITASAGSFFAAEAVLKVSVNKITALYGGAAISAYYWFAAPVLAGTLLGDSRSAWFVWTVRGAVWVLAGAWVVRTWAKEAVFVEQAVAAAAPVSIGGAGLRAARAEQAGDPEITFAPSGLRVAARPGATLLELAEGSEQPIEAGCRIGVCGADPICVVDGMENLSPPGRDEQGTLDRLGYAANTRMACCARINGPVTISLTPERHGRSQVKPIPNFDFDPAVSRVVVVGNGIAGVTAADHVRRRHPECRIDVIANEPYPLYNRMGIGRLVHGKSAMVGLQLLPDSWYEDNEITCWLNTWATRLDCDKREVSLGTGETLAYDRLILATGSDAFVPPIDGFGAPGTFVLRRAADAFAVRGFAQQHAAKTAVVAGGGLLGLEAAYALRKLGLDVVVLERSPGLLSRQLDERSAELLREYLTNLGLHISLMCEAASVETAGGRVCGVRLTDGRVLAADVLMVAAGISPLVDLAAQAGAEIGRGIVVDDGLRTSLADVFAVGDAAEHRGRIYGLWPAAVDQGEIAAENALGGDRRYEGTVPVTMLKVVGVDLLSVGRFTEETGDTVVRLEDAVAHTYRKLVIADGRIVGAILVGGQQDAPHVTRAVKERLDVSALTADLERGEWDGLATAPPPSVAVV